jgi:hypothetical protein
MRRRIANHQKDVEGTKRRGEAFFLWNAIREIEW